MKSHLWNGEWIDDAELEKRVETLSKWIARGVAESPDTECVIAASDRLARILSEKGEVHKGLKSALLDSGAASAEEIDATLSELAKFLNRESLETKLKRELGNLNPFLASRISYQDSIFESWSPLGFLVHISPQNAFTVGPLSILEGLLSGNVNFLKTGGSESLFPQKFVDALIQCDPTHKLKERVIVARISSKKKDLLTRIFAQADGISAWGGEESVQSVRAMAPASTRIVEWGHKISFIYVAKTSFDHPNLLERIAEECCLLEQQACSSPQCLYVETANLDELKDFGKRLSAALDGVSGRIKTTLPGDSEAAEVTMVTEVHRAHSVAERGAVIEATDKSWRILVDDRSPLAASPLYRTIWLKPLIREELIETLRPMRSYLQTCGLECDLSETHELTQKLLASGVERVRRVGEMLGGYSGEPHDGVYALQRYARRVTMQLREDARGISSFSELQKLPAPFGDAHPAVTPKEKFKSSEDDKTAALFFKSGGSTGEPKLSTFTYDQYHEHMRLGAEGLYAAGFDPLHDRAMNLFFGGGLYGGFISFFSALEFLGAVQFPMAAHMDFEMVAKTIVKNRVNTLLGMPSYLLQLFEKGSEALGSYRGIKKIFYGGEHFTEAQKTYLREKFGVEAIRSGAYGSVDIGPIGYQCDHCEGGVHHLQQKLQYLEILKTDEDRPVEGEEVGRLVFTPRMLAGNKPSRYEIGDVGQWVQETGPCCPCGRSSPRFKLLGRMGDIFRIGSFFLNYQKFAQILSSVRGYAGEVQILLTEEKLQEKVIVQISNPCDADPDELRHILLENYPDLNEGVLRDRVLGFEVQSVPTDRFERTSGSGKLIRVVDRRKRG